MRQTFRRLRRNPSTCVVGVGFLAVAVAYTARSTFGMAMPVWERELDWSQGETSTIAATGLLLMALIAPLSGLLLDRQGLRATLYYGVGAIFLSCALVAVSTSLPLLFFAFALIGGVGYAIVGTHVISAAVARLYPRHVGIATGIATSGSAAGQFLILPFIAWIFMTLDWRWGFISLAVLCGIVILLIPAMGQDGARPTSPSATKTGVRAGYGLADVRVLAISPVFHLIFWGFLICGFTTTGVIETHFLPYASFCGFAPLPGATAYGLLSATNVLGMILVGWLTDHMNRPLLLGGIYLIRAFAFWLLLNVNTSYESLLIFAFIFGLVDYSTVPVTSSLVVSHLGLRMAGLVMGLLTAGHQIGASLGAALGGYIFVHYSSYELIWTSSALLVVLAAALCFFIRDTPAPSRDAVLVE